MRKMGRLAWYAGVSTILAGGVIVTAFNQRANFYSACVYLAQSNLCLMILINLILLIYGMFMYGLQRLCYGPLRAIEIEQLYEKSWFAITETCLAMTIFREEVGAWFLVMFVALLTGKVWGWIGDGRVEVLEQQPPLNPRLFHMRLSVSLTLSVLYDLWLMNYTISTVIQQARPNMMVMFLFEFAVLTTSSLATACRYCISLVEASVVKKQTQERLLERRREVREQRAEMIRQREQDAAARAAGEEPNDDAAQLDVPLPSEDDVDEMDIEVSGWEAKGQWVLTLDLATDFIKLGIYVTFFVILLMFYGLPIHIMRDVFMTARSFLKRLATFYRYRRATRDMNTKYDDATVEDIQREDTCIICREEMRPWSVTNPQAPPVAPGALPPARPAGAVNERNRPKKLPCGHILHLGCLKSWLERQQVCPTCRRPVVDNPATQATGGAANNANQGPQGGQRALPGQNDAAGPQAPARGPGRGMRMLNIGPLRVGFGQANLQDLQNMGAPQALQDNAVNGPRVYGLELGFPRRAQQQANVPEVAAPIEAAAMPEALQQIEQRIMTEIRALQLAQQELHLVQLLQAELGRLRGLQNGGVDHLTANFPMPQRPTILSMPLPLNQTQMQRHVARPNTIAIPAGSDQLPPGVTIPEGWSLLPLQRLDSVFPGPVAAGNAGTPGLNSTATTQRAVSPMASGSNNNTPAPTRTSKPEQQQHQSSASSVGSADVNASQTPTGVVADQSTDSASNATVSEATSSRDVSSGPSTIVSEPAPTRTMASGLRNEGESSTLPNWGSGQLFANPSSSAEASTNQTSDIPGSIPTATARGPSEEGQSSQPPESYGESADPTMDDKGKSKAKTVTVEDAEDE